MIFLKNMCSINNDIEDMIARQSNPDKIYGRLAVNNKDAIFLNIPNDTINKYYDFVNDFVDKCKDEVNLKLIEKSFDELRRKYRINPTKNQMRYIVSDKYDKNNLSPTFNRYIIKKGTRSESGVLVATITLPPDNFSCSKNCYYCPQEYDLDNKPSQPRSYISSEPAMRRALRYKFDIMGQFHDRIYCYIKYK